MGESLRIQNVPVDLLADPMASIRRVLFRLPGETRIYPGHNEPSTIAAEQAINPFVR